MIKRGKYYTPPPNDGKDIKQLFAYAVEKGLGQPVDEEGVPKNQWTPETLADAISMIDHPDATANTRTVQYWFDTKNQRNISPSNCRWLARIFGCGEADPISEWQTALLTARRVFLEKRSNMDHVISVDDTIGQTASTSVSSSQLAYQQKAKQVLAPPEIQTLEQNKASAIVAGSEIPVQRGPLVNLARRSAALFGGSTTLDLPLAIFAGAVTLGFLTYFLGVHDVTYNPIDGLTKQVGFLWAPGWTLEGMLLMPLFLSVVKGLLLYWKDERQSLWACPHIETDHEATWLKKIDSHAIAYLVIFLACFFIVFLLQWTTTYVSAFTSGSLGSGTVDWMLISLVRPEVMSTTAAFFLSMAAFIYGGLMYWVYFIGLLLLHTMAEDFSEANKGQIPNKTIEDRHSSLRAASTMMRAVYRCTVFGILTAICIKLNIAYLSSDGSHIVSWFLNDALMAIGQTDQHSSTIFTSSLPYFTSTLLVMITCFVFFSCYVKISSVLGNSSDADSLQDSHSKDATLSGLLRMKWAWYRMIGTLGLLIVAFALTGVVQGYSLVLLCSSSLAFLSLFQGCYEKTPLASDPNFSNQQES